MARFSETITRNFWMDDFSYVTVEKTDGDFVTISITKGDDLESDTVIVLSVSMSLDDLERFNKFLSQGPREYTA